MRAAISLWSALGLLAGVLSAAPERVAEDEQTLRDAKVATDGAALIDYFKKRTLPDVDAGKIESLTKQLGADDFLTRERASARLVALRTLAIPFLEQAARDKDIEVARRAEECLRRIGGSRSTAVDLAAVRVLAARKPAGAAEVLLGFLPFAGNERIADEVQKALTALAVRDGKSDPALLDALRDKQDYAGDAARVARLVPEFAEIGRGFWKGTPQGTSGCAGFKRNRAETRQSCQLRLKPPYVMLAADYPRMPSRYVPRWQSKHMRQCLY